MSDKRKMDVTDWWTMLGVIVTACVIIATVSFGYGKVSEKQDSLATRLDKQAARIDKVADDVTDIKVGVGKIETLLPRLSTSASIRNTNLTYTETE